MIFTDSLERVLKELGNNLHIEHLGFRVERPSEMDISNANTRAWIEGLFGFAKARNFHNSQCVFVSERQIYLVSKVLDHDEM